MGMWDRFFTALASAKRAAAEASAEIVTRLGLPGVILVLTGTASAGVDEIQVVTIDADGGTFVLAYGGIPSAPIAFDATAGTVQSTLRAAINEQQGVTVDATGGTFTLTYSGQTTSALAFDVSAADLKAALEALSNIDAAAITCTGGPGDAGGTTPYLVTMGGNLAGGDRALMTADAASLTGGAHSVTVTEARKGRAANTAMTVAGSAGGPWTVTFGGAAATDIALMTIDDSALTKTGSVTIATVTAGTHTAAEADTQMVTVKATSGTFKLTYSGQQTGALAFGSTAAEVQTALEALSNIAADSADVIVTGGPGDALGSWPYVITYVAGGALAASDIGVTAQDIDLANSGEVRVDRTVEGSPNFNEQQVITKRSGTSGTFRLTFDGQQTGTIAYNASAADVQTALRALSNIGPSDVDVTGDAGGPWTVEFKEDMALAGQSLITVSVNSLVVADSITAGQVMVGNAASTAVNEVQSVTVTGTGGTFTLTYSGQTTSAIAFDASAADVQAALEALSNIAVGDVIVSGPAGGPFMVEFSGTLRYTNVDAMTASAASLTDDIGASTVEETVKGEVAGTDLGFKVQVPDGAGGWTDYATVASALVATGTDVTTIHPTAVSADVTLPCPTEFRILPTQTGVWTYTITGQFVP